MADIDPEGAQETAAQAEGLAKDSNSQVAVSEIDVSIEESVKMPSPMPPNILVALTTQSTPLV